LWVLANSIVKNLAIAWYAGHAKGLVLILIRFLNLIPGIIVVPGGNSEIIVQVVVHPLNQLTDCQMIGNVWIAMAQEGIPIIFVKDLKGSYPK